MVLKKNQGTLLTNFDVAKFICALLIVVIHTDPLKHHSPIIRFYLNNVIARIAVPLFFAMSGFLLFGKMSWEGGKIRRCTENYIRLKKYLRNLLVLYTGWSAVYIAVSLPGWYRTGWWGTALVKDAIVSFFVRGSHYHLWYLLASIYAAGILYWLLTRIRFSRLIWLLGIFWILECITYSYDWIGFDRSGILSVMAAKLPILFDTVFRAVPLLAIGALCAVRHASGMQKSMLVSAVLSFTMCALEASLLYFFTPNRERYSYLFTTPFFAFYALEVLVGGKQFAIRPQTARVLRNSSLIIYCLHPLLLQICKGLALSSGICQWFVTTVSSVIIAIIWSLYTYKKKLVL